MIYIFNSQEEPFAFLQLCMFIVFCCMLDTFSRACMYDMLICSHCGMHITQG